MLRMLVLLCLLIVSINHAWAKTLVWGTEATFPPYVSLDAQQKLVGLDADIAQAICQQMQVECKFVDAPWDSLITSLNLGKFDAIWGGMDKTAERAKRVAFSQTLYVNEASFVGRKHADTNTIKGKRIGTQRGNTFEYYLKDIYGSTINLKTYASTQQAFMDLKLGRLDLVLSDLPTIRIWLNQDNNKAQFGLVGPRVKSEKHFGLGHAIAFAKHNQDLRDRVDKALDELRAQGILQTIINHYTPNA